MDKKAIARQQKAQTDKSAQMARYADNRLFLSVHLAEIIRDVAAVVGVVPQSSDAIIRHDFQTQSPSAFAFSLLRSRANQPHVEDEISLLTVENILNQEFIKRGFRRFAVSVDFTDKDRYYYAVTIIASGDITVPQSLVREFQNVGTLFYDSQRDIYDIIYPSGRLFGGLLPGRRFYVWCGGGWVQTEVAINSSGYAFFVGFANTGLKPGTAARV